MRCATRTSIILTSQSRADFFKNAILWPGPKKQITLRIDPDVLTFFRKHGRGYQTTMNAVLRKYMEARKSLSSSRTK
jgi:uncharacterized protein (DUF4415 family)